MSNYKTFSKNLAEEYKLLTKAELDLLIAELKRDLTHINGQIEEWHTGSTPERMDEEWREKATRAVNHKKLLLTTAKVEVTRRQADIGNSPAADRGHAFIRAARIKLDKQIIEEIWELAAEMEPEPFNR